MSGTKTTCFFLCLIYCTSLSAVVWNTASSFIVVEKNPISYSLSPFSYPDSLCFASSWSSLYHGFNIQETMFYAGWQHVDLSLKSQLHPLMSNHELSFGFHILNQEQVQAGLQLHYACSILYGQDTQHEGSVSTAIAVHPQENWDISFYSLRFLSFPRDSVRSLFESQTGIVVGFDLLPSLKFNVGLEKQEALSWEMIIAFNYLIINPINVTIAYTFQREELALGLCFTLDRWKILCHVFRHEYLGFNENIIVAYDF